MKSKRTQAERSAASRAALVAAARPLFAEKGYAAVGTDEIARAAGVTRGALYHQFDGKEELFVAVYRQIESELGERLATALSTSELQDPVAIVHANIDAWLAACAEPELHQIGLIQAPAVLGWERWREIGREYGVGMVEAVLRTLIDAGVMPAQPVRPLAHLLVGAFEEAALYATRAEDPVGATAEVRQALFRLVDGLLQE